MTKNIGTPLYIAPEQEYSSSYNNKVDIYALGLILFELFQNMSTTHERFSMIKDLK
jgi:serine/threonine protein kinase